MIVLRGLGRDIDVLGCIVAVGLGRDVLYAASVKSIYILFAPTDITVRKDPDDIII